MSTYELGILIGNTWRQNTNSAGQSFYVNIATGQSQFTIPAGWEDHPNDNWVVDNSRNWTQWRNTRTGRFVLRDPNPPAPQTYLDVPTIAAHMRLVERTPDSPEALYRRPMLGILRWLFPDRNGFDVIQEELANNGKPDFMVFKISCRPGGSDYGYTFALVESKTIGKPWGATEDQCREYCMDSGNESDQVYGIIQIGLEVRFYKYNNGIFTTLSNKLHLRNDVHLVIQWADYMQNNPLPFVRV